MKCDEIQQLLEISFDGEGAGQSQADLAQHLHNCGACRKFLAQLETESQVYSAYPASFGVPHDLWRKVQSGIGEAQLDLSTHAGFLSVFPRRLTLPLVSVLATAAVLIALGVTVVVMKSSSPNHSRPDPVNEPQSARSQRPGAEVSGTANEQRDQQAKPDIHRGTEAMLRPAREKISRLRTTTQLVNSPDQQVRGAEQKYLMAIAMLSREAGRKRSRLDSSTLVRLDQALASVDRTIAGTRKVVRQHPDDPVAVQYMLSAYSRKVDVLREMVGY